MIDFCVKLRTGGIDFGLSDQGNPDFATIREMALLCERLGYQAVLLTDHIALSQGPLPECWITLSALAAITTKIKVGPFASVLPYRHPVLLAKMAATLDDLSGGRLQLFVGAGGWGQDVQKRVYGIEMPPVGERLERLREAVLVMRKMWSEEAVSFQGKYYSLDGAVCNPKPAQKPLPVWIGGSKEHLLRVAAEVADGWDAGLCTPDGYDRMAEVLERHCESIGRDVAEISRSYNCETVIIAPSESELSRRKARLFEPMLRNKQSHAVDEIRQMPEADYLARRAPFVGTPQQIVDQIGEFKRRGVTNFVLNFPDLEKRESLQRFAEEVIPAFRTNE